MSSVTTPHGKKRHRSAGVWTATGDEHMRCGLWVLKPNITRNWREPDCKGCTKVSKWEKKNAIR